MGFTQAMVRKYPIIKLKPMIKEENENDIYSDSGITEMAEDDQLSLEENGFMLGYLSA